MREEVVPGRPRPFPIGESALDQELPRVAVAAPDLLDLVQLVGGAKRAREEAPGVARGHVHAHAVEADLESMRDIIRPFS